MQFMIMNKDYKSLLWLFIYLSKKNQLKKKIIKTQKVHVRFNDVFNAGRKKTAATMAATTTEETYFCCCNNATKPKELGSASVVVTNGTS